LREEEKKNTPLLFVVIFVRDFYPKRKEDLVCVVREQSKEKKRKKKEKFRRQKEQLLSFQARFFALKRLCFITRAEAHTHIYKRIRANNLYIYNAGPVEPRAAEQSAQPRETPIETHVEIAQNGNTWGWRLEKNWKGEFRRRE